MRVTNVQPMKATVLRQVPIVLVGLAMAVNAQAGTVRVAPDGSDQNPGTQDNPFATPERARDEVRAMRATIKDKEISVNVKGGEYRISHKPVFSMADSGGAEGRTVFQAAPGEKPVLSSGIPVTSKHPGWAW